MYPLKWKWEWGRRGWRRTKSKKVLHEFRELARIFLRLQKVLEGGTGKEHGIIPSHCLNWNFAPQQIHPAVGKIFALLRLHWLDSAEVAIEENAGVVGASIEGKSFAVFAEAGVIPDEVLFA